MNDLFKLALLMGGGAAFVLVLTAAEKSRHEQKLPDPTRVPGFVDLMRCYGALLDSANDGRHYAVDPARKLHFVLEEPIEDDLFPGFTRTRFVGDLPRFVCVDGDDTVPDYLRHSVRDAFMIAAREALRALEARPHIMEFYARHPKALGHISARIVDRPFCPN